MKKKSYNYLAVDISKKHLQMRTTEEDLKLDYQTRGIRRIIAKAQSEADMMVVLEATGGYERRLLDALHEAGIACACVNPGRIRAFAKSEGVKAKTDPIDALMILRFAQEKKLQPIPAPTVEQKELAALLDRRHQLDKMLSNEKNRLQNTPRYIHADIRSLMRTLKAKMQRLEQKIQERIAHTPSLQEQAQVIRSVTGVGLITTASILAYVPEIIQISRNQLAALVGVAPYNRDSGSISKKRTIHAGRSKVRKVLYMATMSASKHNPVIRDYIKGLKARGKEHKCAMVAAMRKLLLHIQSELRKSAYAA
jgi:transposase